MVILRSDSLESGQLLSILDQFAQRCRDATVFARIRRSQEYEFIDELWPACFKLNALEADDLTIAHYAVPGSELNPFFNILGQYGSDLFLAGLRWDIREAERLRKVKDQFDLWLSVGWSYYPDWKAGYYYCGLDVGGASPAANDMRYRYDLFRRFLAAMNLQNSVHVNLSDETLRMSADVPWRIRFSGAEIDGANPFAFRVCGFANFHDALQSAQDVVKQLSRSVKEIKFHAKMRPRDYARLRNSLNQAARGWELRIFGTHTPEADALLRSGHMTEATPERIPALKWSEYVDGQEFRFFCDVIATPKGVCLEITSNCGNAEKVLGKVRSASDLKWSVTESITE